MGYSLTEFFLISKSSKNKLLKALNSLNFTSHESETMDTKSIGSVDFYSNNFHQNMDAFEEASKEITPIKRRASSRQSQDEKSSRRSAKIYSNKCSKHTVINLNEGKADKENHFRRCASKDKKTPIMLNNFVQSQHIPAKSTPKYKYSEYPPVDSRKHVLVSKNMNLVQQEEPQTSQKSFNKNRKYCLPTNRGKQVAVDSYTNRVEQNLHQVWSQALKNPKKRLKQNTEAHYRVQNNFPVYRY